ncbi:ABC transporter substrate-binding protein [Cognatiyoonia sp. IB215182]|uniref:ABC transporter substrate-binding protein n=1 Tax=Cognatiyoonia sp. IB215182 TaxID=3097353 RepID=UPI002A11F6D6|nr:ABC transporter substrate-binding protein [Cognatiyoonia sp. IB215182]MDX8353807.1 ABC transporter substrate-binding protein [Cognatiyoonia sp. IB215182]
MTKRVTSACAASAILFGLATQASSQELTPVTFGTNWVAQAEHGGFYQSVADGTYEACGLDVTILPGGPQVNNQALMLAGRIDFYMGGHLDAYFAVQEGLPIVNVMASFQKDPQVLMTHPGKVDSFAGMQEADLTMIVQDAATYYEWMKAAYAFTDEVRQPYTFNSAPFLANEDSAQQGYLSSEPFAILQETGIEVDVWLIADAGYDAYSTTIQTKQEVLDEQPEVVRCFVESSILGWYNYLYGDNSAANELILSDNPDMTQDKIDFAIEAMIENGIVDSGDTLELGIGAMTAERSESFYNDMVEAGVLPAGLEFTKAYDLTYINQGLGLELRPE